MSHEFEFNRLQKTHLEHHKDNRIYMDGRKIGYVDNTPRHIAPLPPARERNAVAQPVTWEQPVSHTSLIPTATQVPPPSNMEPTQHEIGVAPEGYQYCTGHSFLNYQNQISNQHRDLSAGTLPFATASYTSQQIYTPEMNKNR